MRLNYFKWKRIAVTVDRRGKDVPGRDGRCQVARIRYGPFRLVVKKPVSSLRPGQSDEIVLVVEQAWTIVWPEDIWVCDSGMEKG
jgi:hypothetical protein